MSLKTKEDEHSIQAQWFLPDEVLSLNLRSPLGPIVIELINRRRREVPVLPVDNYNTWT